MTEANFVQIGETKKGKIWHTMSLATEPELCPGYELGDPALPFKVIPLELYKEIVAIHKKRDFKVLDLVRCSKCLRESDVFDNGSGLCRNCCIKEDFLKSVEGDNES